MFYMTGHRKCLKLTGKGKTSPRLVCDRWGSVISGGQTSAESIKLKAYSQKIPLVSGKVLD